MNKQSSEIRQAFEDLRKEELNTLRKMGGYPIKTNLNKADLADALEDNFRKNPVSLLKTLPIYDLLILSNLCEADRDGCLRYDNFPDMLYSMTYNIIEWDFADDDETKIDLWLTDDMQMLISPFIDQVIEDVKKTGRYMIDYFFWGMLWLYGVPTAKDYLRVIKQTFGPEEKDWWPMYMELCRYFPFADMNIDGVIINPAISDPEYVFREQLSRGMGEGHYKEYSMKEIIEVGSTGPYFHYGKDTKVCRDAVAALKKCGFSEREAVSRLSRVWFDVQDADGPHRPTQIIQSAIGEPHLDSVDELNSIIRPLTEYMNSIPRWILGGRIPKEMPVNPEAKIQMASMASAMGKMATMRCSRGVGRNDSCPCGSGLKFKNCHGKNIS